MSDYLVCPECGCDTFDQRRYVTVNVTVRLRDGGCDLEDVSEDILDRGETDESCIVCQDCGEDYPHDTDELVTPEHYERAGKWFDDE